MHPVYPKGSKLTEGIIGAAIEVHRDKGAGLAESICEWRMIKELGLRQLTAVNQKTIQITYKGFTQDEPLRFDLLVEDCVLIEAKLVDDILPIPKVQLLNYSKLLNFPL